MRSAEPSSGTGRAVAAPGGTRLPPATRSDGEEMAARGGAHAGTPGSS